MTATRQTWSEDAIGSLHGRTAVVTGANSGVGLATAHLLAAYGVRVVLACRDKGKGLEAAGHVAHAAPGAVNNAGVTGGPRRRTADGLEMHLGTNHLGHFALTGLLLPSLLA